MLQKLEIAYLAILRTVVIVGSGVLLVGVFIFGWAALNGLVADTEYDVVVPKIEASTIIGELTASAQEEKQQQVKDNIPVETTNSVDSNQQHYNSTAKSISEFVAKTSNGEIILNESLVAKSIKDHAKELDLSELVTAYAKGLSETTKTVLADKKIEELARKTSPTDVADQVIYKFSTEFVAQKSADEEARNAKLLKHAEAKASAANNLYLAAASFGMFLLVVFLSIFIKIERNLRHLESITT